MTNRKYVAAPHEYTKCGSPRSRFPQAEKRAGFELDKTSSQDRADIGEDSCEIEG
jgi:hypothetical protein